MVNDMLDLQRVDSGQFVLPIEAVALAPLWDALCSAASPLAARRGVHLAVAALPTHAAVQADARRLQQVLAKLLGNAIKYSREGGTVTLAAAATGPHWRLSIADTGPGIPQAQLPHLFEAFNRLGREGPGAGGVGIGLVLARSLVQQMGGELTVHSTVGAGTTVEVDLPRAAAAGPA
jgi:signal transduction histidine kinase